MTGVQTCALPIYEKQVTLKDFLTKDDYWTREAYRVVNGEKVKMPVGIYIKHNAIQRLARICNISLSSVKYPVVPTASNEQEHLLLGKFKGGFKVVSKEILKGNGKGKKKTKTLEPSITKNQITTLEVGEASIRNTMIGVSRNYLGSMAFKRLFDRGILNHLGFFELYSEDEADEFSQAYEERKISLKELEEIKPFLEIGRAHV